MKLLKFALLLLFINGCANTESVDDSDVQEAIANSEVPSVDDEVETEEPVATENKSAPATSAASTVKTNGISSQPLMGEAATLLYNIASSALKKSDTSLSYSVKCTYIMKPMSIKNCLVKTGFLPAEAKNKVGKALLEAKHLTRKKSANNEVSIFTNYLCSKSKGTTEIVCILDK